MKRTRIRRDTEQARAFRDRGRESSARSFGRARDLARETALAVGGPRSTLKATAGRRKATIPKPVRRRVLRRSEGLCICGCEQRATQIHHVLDEAKFPELALVEDNMVGVHHDCNQRHHFAPNGRIPRERLPRCAIRLAGTQPRYMVFLERTYPAPSPQATPGEAHKEKRRAA